MAQFNLNDYETVEQRIKRFYTDHPQGRIITKNLTTKQDRLASTWVVEAKIFIPNYLWGEDGIYKQYILKATGLAFEVDGQGMANKTSALENAETSSIGRALANAGYSGNRRTSREEMEKVQRANTPKRDWIAEAEALTLNYNLEGLRKLYSEAVIAHVDAETLNKVKQYGADVSSGLPDSASKPNRS